MTKYARRRALVVGAATGIGLAIAKRLVEGGASVVLTARTDAERAHAVAELGSAAYVVGPSDVASALAPRSATGSGQEGAARSGHGGAAGSGPVGAARSGRGSAARPGHTGTADSEHESSARPGHRGTAGDWHEGSPDSGVDLLFADAIPTARPLLPYVEDGGAIVLTASTPCPDAVQALAAELAFRGIRVNAVAPGCIEAPGSGAVPLPPLGRLGAAEEVARAALFLATEATFTTGARLPVDGGLGHP